MSPPLLHGRVSKAIASLLPGLSLAIAWQGAHAEDCVAKARRSAAQMTRAAAHCALADLDEFPAYVDDSPWNLGEGITLEACTDGMRALLAEIGRAERACKGGDPELLAKIARAKEDVASRLRFHELVRLIDEAPESPPAESAPGEPSDPELDRRLARALTCSHVFAERAMEGRTGLDRSAADADDPLTRLFLRDELAGLDLGKEEVEEAAVRDYVRWLEKGQESPEMGLMDGPFGPEGSPCPWLEKHERLAQEFWRSWRPRAGPAE